MPTQLLIDGHSLLFRAYHALPPLTTRAGVPTGAIHGFASMLMKVVENEHPDRVVVVFDAPQATFRHEQYAEYKAQREEAPDDFRQQMPWLRQLLERLGVPVLSIGGFEADDTLGTLARMGTSRGYQSLIVTGDRDLLQLVDEDITVLLTSRTGISDLDRVDRDGVKAKMGVWPEQVPDLKGLMGDGSDNIPGVAGIGQKSALALMDRYGSVEAIIANLDSIDNTRWKNALRGHEHDARRYRDLATIVTEVPVEWPPIEEPFQWRIGEDLHQLLDELELSAIRRRLGFGETPKTPSQTAQPGRALVAPKVVEESELLWDASALYSAYDDGHVLWIFDARQEVAVGRERGDYPPVPLVAWGVKETYREAFQEGLELPIFAADVKLEAYLLDSERKDYGLWALAGDAGIQVGEVEGPKGAAAIWALSEIQQELLRERSLERLYREVELPLAKVLASMEAVGVLVDRDGLEKLGRELTASIAETEKAIYELAGAEFNINSQRQLGEILFDRLGLPALKRTKTGFSTDADTLEALRPLHAIVDQILAYRQLVKIQSTYVEGLLPLIQSNGRIHTTFHQTVAATGRLSSSDPNLQNIPVRVPLGRRVRGVFIPTPGRSLLAADYSQIELRVLAHLAGDANLLQAFLDEEDIHRRTASEIFNIPIEAVDSTWRSRAKAVNFGIIYGISDFGLARDTGVSRAEAKDYIARYYSRYPDLKRYFDGVIDTARSQGYVSTILGRRRLLPDILSKNHVRRQYAERMAMNTAIQGSAADLIKVAMLRIDAGMKEQGLKSDMLLQVHDELIWDALPDEVEALVELARNHMANAIPLSVPLVIEFKRGPNWEAMEPWGRRHA